MRHTPRFLRPAVFAASVLISQSAFAATLSREQIAQQIIGKDLTTVRLGMTARLRYNVDGSVNMKAGFISGSGSWAYAEDGLCMTMVDGPKRGKTCTTFEALEDGSYRNSEGQILRVQQ
ncbi:MAG: hypothetical protein KUL88_14915 [Rhizobium sp.]|nr:hypothetical protein [Rhizobium sp.]